MAEACYFRSFLNKGYPLDYYLWQNGKLCEGKEADINCAPDPPEVLYRREEVDRFEAGAMRPDLKRLPNDQEELAGFLIRAAQRGQITWIDRDDPAIYEVVQNEVDSARTGQNVHMVFGFPHLVVGQTEFFNELLTEGYDGRKIRGVTHLALELARMSSNGRDLQNYLDIYLAVGAEGFKPRIYSINWEGTNIPMEVAEETRSRNDMLEISYYECYNTVFANLPEGTSDAIESSLGQYYWMAAREIYAVESVSQRLDPGGGNVVFWRWGGSHAEKHRFPFYLGIQDPGAKVVSVVFNGGTYVRAYAFDRALENLGWLEKKFILRLDGYREADYVIHLPTQGRRIEQGISNEGNPVIQNIFEPQL